jgi:hypothetical protein
MKPESWSRRGTERLRNAALVAVLFALPAGLLAPPATAGTPVEPGDPVPVLTERAKVVEAWRHGGPGVQEAAEAALSGTDEAVRQFLASGLASTTAQDDRVQVAQLLATAGPAVKTAAQAALSGAPEEIEAFLTTGVRAPGNRTRGSGSRS